MRTRTIVLDAVFSVLLVIEAGLLFNPAIAAVAVVCICWGVTVGIETAHWFLLRAISKSEADQ